MSANRLTLPGDFQDIVSQKMLSANITDRVFAKLMKAAGVKFGLDAVSASSMGITPERSPSSNGASVLTLGDQMLDVNDGSLQTGVVMVSDELKEGTGHTVTFNRQTFSGGGYTLEARRHSASTVISQTPIEIGMTSTYLTLERLRGPFASGGSVVQPYAIDLLDSKRSIHNHAQMCAYALEYDRVTFVDTVIGAMLTAAATIAQTDTAGLKNYITPGGGTKDLDSLLTAPASARFDLETVLRGAKTLSARGVPRLPDGHYIAFIDETQELHLKLDGDFKDCIKGNGPQNNPLYADHITSIEKVHIYRVPTLTTDTTTVSGNTIRRGFMMGMDALGYAVGSECEVRPSSDDNYGNTAKFIWQAFEAYGVLDTSRILGLHSD